MEDFPKNIKIEMQPDNIPSLRAALQRYTILMHSGEAFQPADFSTFLNVEFVVAENEKLPRKLQFADVGQHYPLLQACFALNQERYRPNLEHQLEFGDESHISEPLFFAHTLQFPELKEDIIAAAKAMVHYARKVNDTSDMWVDGMHIFGLEALYMLARIHPEYSWLLAQLHIPYWDFEHVVCSDAYIRDLAERHGWSRDIIKAYLWCDNGRFRQSFYAELDCCEELRTSLAIHLKENPDDYAFFKQTLIERFKREPVLAYTDGDDEEDEQPILKFYQTLQLDWGTEKGSRYDEEDEDEVAQQYFIDDTLENEAAALQALIEEAGDTPLIKIAESRASDYDDDDEDDDYFIRGQGTEMLREFFIKGIDNGEEIWAYITQGINADLLDDIEPVDIIELIAEKELSLKKKTDWFVGALEPIDEQLVDVLGDYLYDLFGDEDDEDEDEAVSNSGFVVAVNVRKDGANVSENSADTGCKQSGQQLLRTLDVFKALMDVEELNGEIRELVVEDHELLSDEAFDQRFGHFTEAKKQTPEQIRSKTLHDLRELIDYIDDDEIRQEQMKDFDRYVERDREALLDLRWNKNNIVCYALAAHQLRKDFDNRHGDEVTQKLLDFLDIGFFECFLKHLFKKSELKPGEYGNDTGLTDADQALIREHFTQPMPKGGDEKAARAEVLALLREHLTVDESHQITELQPYYELFFYGGGQAETMVIYKLLKRVPVQIMPQLSRLFDLFINLAPQRIINYIVHMETDDATADFDDEMKRIDFFSSLVKLGVPRPDSLAYQAMNPIDSDNYQRLVTIYSEIDSEEQSMFSAMYKKQATDLAEGLKRVPQEKRVSFYHAVHKQSPEMGFRAEDEFWGTLKCFINKNTVSWDEKLARQFSDEEKVYFGDIDEFVNERPIMRNDATLADQYFKLSRFDQDVLVMQQRGEAWYLLKHDKDFKFEQLDGEQIRPVRPHPCTRILALAEGVKADKIAQLLTPQQPEPNRIEHIFSELCAYLKGERSLSDTLALCHFELNAELRTVQDYYGFCGLEHFIWKLDDELRDRLVRLLINISADGFDMIASQYGEDCPLDTEDANIDEDEDEDEDDKQNTALLSYLLSQQPPLSHLVRYCIDSREDVMHQYLIHLGEEGKLFAEIDNLNLSVKERIRLMDIFDDYDDTEALIAHFKNDPSRKVSNKAKQLLK